MFDTTFDIRNVWIITLLSIILILILYIYISSIVRRKKRVRLRSHFMQTETNGRNCNYV